MAPLTGLLAVVPEKVFDPGEIGFLGTDREVHTARVIADLLQEWRVLQGGAPAYSTISRTQHNVYPRFLHNALDNPLSGAV
jgi:hypothetical protein